MDYNERSIALAQMAAGMRIVEVKFGPFDRETGIPHNQHDGIVRRYRTSQKLKRYYYKCLVPGVEVGDVVVVEVGYFYGVATVTDVLKFLPIGISAPKLKYVLSIADVSQADYFHQHEQKAVREYAIMEEARRIRDLELKVDTLAADAGVDPVALRRALQALREDN